jgi:putative molybdopterin biosynthesis protein
MGTTINKRNVYLKMKTLAEARKLLFQSFQMRGILSAEPLPVPEAVGRILAEPITARVCSPGFHAAAMDGYAVKAETTFGASETRPRTLTLGTDAHPVNTGHVLPEDTDAVIMIEHVHMPDQERIRIEAPAYPWQYVRKMGEDIVATELLFPQNHVITPYCVGALLSGGITTVPVKKKPVVWIFPTGSELVDWRRTDAQQLVPGQILETNSYVLEALVTAAGGTCVRSDIVPDDVQQLKTSVAKAAGGDAHIILMVGGSSAGSEDHTRTVIADLGEILVHGVTMMPGKPVIMGRLEDTPVFGMPGYPVSTIVAFEQLVRPLIRGILGQPDTKPETIPVEPTRKIPSKLGVEEFLRVKLGKVKDRVVATPMQRGAGSITSITEADGIIRIANHLEGINEHEQVSAELLKPMTTVENTIVIVGSHDNTLDLLSNQIRAEHPGLTVSSSHVGSMGGLMALKRGVCHVAGSHLLDTTDGSYNVSYIKKLLPRIPVKLVTLMDRQQGLVVSSGNPKGISGIQDLVRDDIQFINRQTGSGTRILLDYRLRQLGIAPADVSGYTTEEYTHMAVAVAVLGGAADVGLGIHAAARALNLDFIPVVTEQYDLVIPGEFFESSIIRVLLETINSDAFKQQVVALGGYDTKKTGNITEVG